MCRASTSFCRKQDVDGRDKPGHDGERGIAMNDTTSQHSYPIAPPASERRVLGHAVPRIEDLPLVTGRGRYAGDINFPHQLHMRIVRSPKAHGRIMSIDTSAARALPGVYAVWTSAD